MSDNKVFNKKLRALRALLVLATGLLGSVAAMALEVVDDRGVKHSFASAPQRIVSLVPSLTETVCELGQCPRLVGVDRYSNFPASVRALPQVGGGLDPSVEAVLALKPDVVLAFTGTRAIERLESLGVPVVALSPKSSADVQRILAKVGQLLEVSDAQRVWRVIDAGVQAAAQSLPPRVKQVRVYFEASAGPYGAGEASFIGEVLARLGVKNIIPAAMGPFPKLNPEFVVRANPDLIMVGERAGHDMAQRPGWQGIAALRHQRLCTYKPEESDVLVRPGPRMAEAARIMAACIARHYP